MPVHPKRHHVAVKPLEVLRGGTSKPSSDKESCHLSTRERPHEACLVRVGEGLVDTGVEERWSRIEGRLIVAIGA
jgi:hypothetical protein